MNLSFQMILANVTDLDRSAEFYSEVFEFQVASRDSEVVTLMVNHDDRHQVLVLRRTHNALRPGRGLSRSRLPHSRK
jgi:catechol-2,3-dioxygenase